MTRDEVKEIIMIMSCTYPNYKPLDLKRTVDIWSVMLAPYKADHIKTALYTYILSDTKGFAPSVGQLIDMLPRDIPDLTELEAWSIVSKAISNSGYNAKSEFEKLPILIQETIGSFELLQEWALMEIETVQSVIQSNFIRNYKQVLLREEKRLKLPQTLRNAIDKVKKELSEEKNFIERGKIDSEHNIDHTRKAIREAASKDL